jgi:RimJ/RimL family protein N-acetyltransferase
MDTGNDSSHNEGGVTIRRLRLLEVGVFARLRAQIEREAAHLAVAGGERKEGIPFILLRIFINRRRMFTLVAEQNGALLGFITVLFPKFRKLRKNAYLTVSVRQSERGRGIGTKLITHAEAFARERGARRLELDVFAKNEGALRLYEKLGFEHEGRRRQAVDEGDGYDDIIFMGKLLETHGEHRVASSKTSGAASRAYM